MLKDRDFDVTSYIIAHIDSKWAGGSVNVCEVCCEDGRRRVARGGNVGCSVECDMECTMVTSGGGI